MCITTLNAKSQKTCRYYFKPVLSFEQVDYNNNLEETRADFKKNIERLSSLNCDSVQEIKEEVANRFVSVLKLKKCN